MKNSSTYLSKEIYVRGALGQMQHHRKTSKKDKLWVIPKLILYSYPRLTATCSLWIYAINQSFRQFMTYQGRSWNSEGQLIIFKNRLYMLQPYFKLEQAKLWLKSRISARYFPTVYITYRFTGPTMQWNQNLTLMLTCSRFVMSHKFQRS